MTHSTEKPFECDMCDFRCKQKGNLDRHKMQIHINERPFKCNECDYASKTRSSLQQHIRGKHSNQSFACEITGCQYRTNWPNVLKNHQKEFHSNVRPFACKECDYRSKTNGNLQKHIRAVHKQEKPFSCHFCDFKTAVRRDLVQHEAIHNDVRPFKCLVQGCGYGSNRVYYLKEHVKRKHAGIEDFPCHVCSKRFYLRIQLKRHLSIIHGDHDSQSCKNCLQLKQTSDSANMWFIDGTEPQMFDFSGRYPCRAVKWHDFVSWSFGKKKDSKGRPAKNTCSQMRIWTNEWKVVKLMTVVSCKCQTVLEHEVPKGP